MWWLIGSFAIAVVAVAMTLLFAVGLIAGGKDEGDDDFGNWGV